LMRLIDEQYTRTPFYGIRRMGWWLGEQGHAVNASSYAWYMFTVPPGANTIAVNGHFAATGGGGNDIECYIFDENGFVNFKNGHPTQTYMLRRRCGD
jgi:hypothetical protein